MRWIIFIFQLLQAHKPTAINSDSHILQIHVFQRFWLQRSCDLRSSFTLLANIIQPGHQLPPKLNGQSSRRRCLGGQHPVAKLIKRITVARNTCRAATSTITLEQSHNLRPLSHKAGLGARTEQVGQSHQERHWGGIRRQVTPGFGHGTT